MKIQIKVKYILNSKLFNFKHSITLSVLAVGERAKYAKDEISKYSHKMFILAKYTVCTFIFVRKHERGEKNGFNKLGFPTEVSGSMVHIYNVRGQVSVLRCKGCSSYTYCAFKKTRVFPLYEVK